MELALEVKVHLDFHWVTRPWRRTLTNGNDVKYVIPWCRQLLGHNPVSQRTPTISLQELVTRVFIFFVSVLITSFHGGFELHNHAVWAWRRMNYCMCKCAWHPMLINWSKNSKGNQGMMTCHSGGIRIMANKNRELLAKAVGYVYVGLAIDTLVYQLPGAILYLYELKSWQRELKSVKSQY